MASLIPHTYMQSSSFDFFFISGKKKKHFISPSLRNMLDLILVPCLYSTIVKCLYNIYSDFHKKQIICQYHWKTLAGCRKIEKGNFYILESRYGKNKCPVDSSLSHPVGAFFIFSLVPSRNSGNVPETFAKIVLAN